MQLQQIQSKIFELRGFKVMLDTDLAILYETETKRLKEAVRRNIDRFPSDFMFVLNEKEFESLRTQFASSNRGGTRYLPFAFTEQGVAMLASVLNSAKAIEVNIQIVRAFVLLRQYALTHSEITGKLKELESRYNKQFNDVYEALNYLLTRDKQRSDQNQRKQIGFKTSITD
jgi:phage regulator Rha-like protein